MAKEYAPDGIRSNAICPGSVQTAVLDKYLSDQAEGDPGELDRFHAAGCCPLGFVFTPIALCCRGA